MVIVLSVKIGINHFPIFLYINETMHYYKKLIALNCIFSYLSIMAKTNDELLIECLNESIELVGRLIDDETRIVKVRDALNTINKIERMLPKQLIVRSLRLVPTFPMDPNASDT